MDKTQFAVVQNAARAVAAEAVASVQTEVLQFLIGLAQGDARSQLLAEIERKLNESKIRYQAVVIRGYPPEVSDLVAGEFQEAFERIANEVMAKIKIE